MHYQKKNMQEFSFKWLLFIFYLVFGFLPLVAVSFMTLVAKSQTIEEITMEQMQVSLSQIGLRMDMFYAEARDDLSGFARLIEVPCSISEENLDDKARLELMILKFLSEHQQFEIVAFCDPLGNVVSVADRKTPFEYVSATDSKRFVTAYDRERIIKKFMNPDSRYLPLIFDIRNTQMDAGKKDGYVIALIPIKEIAHIFSTANIGTYVEKQIIDYTGQSLWRHYSPGVADAPVTGDIKIQTYVANIPSLGWKLIARIDDAVIFHNIYNQLYRNIGIAIMVFLMAAGFVFEFGRRITRQLQTLLEGTRAFADGRLDHRVENIYGKEMNALSVELNKMAQKLKKRQSSIIQTNKLESLGLLTAGIAHEIKNPLASIKTSSQVLKQFFLDGEHHRSLTFDTDDMNDIKTLSNGITDEVNRLNSLLREFLDFSKPGASNKSLVDVKSVIEKSLSFLQSDLSMAKIRVEFEVESFFAWIDSDQLTQIMMNILLNAKNVLKGKDGIISIRSGRVFNDENEFYRTVSITDNGPGIPEELIEKIFDPFFSLSRKGTGLGLSIVYILSNQNNIDIEVEGREKEGTRFVLRFPGEILNEPQNL